MPGKRVLIIDDDRQVSLALSIRLQAAGYELKAAYDGESGLVLLAEDPPDGLLLDIRMPGIDGIEGKAEGETSPGGLLEFADQARFQQGAVGIDEDVKAAAGGVGDQFEGVWSQQELPA